MPRLSKIGAAALAAFGWTGLQTVAADYLVVAGGGGGSNGGGGAGGYRTGTTALNLAASYTVTVGAGGAGGNPNNTTNGVNGSNSVFDTITSSGGGGGGNGSSGGLGLAGGSGGGGGGWDSSSTGGAGNTPSTSPSQGNNGGTGSNSGGAGGGGAGAVGGNGSTNVGGNGGAGTASSISGSSVTYAGGGGGRGFNTAGSGGAGGGGAGTTGSGTGSPGTANLGGGGGGSGATNAGGQGGSGIVIISYTGVQQFGGGVVTSSGGKTIHTFTTSGTLSPIAPLTASYLIVAGGGGGGGEVGGGGGAGGLLSGSGLAIDTNSIYAITVGAAGAAGGATGPNGSGGNGGNSSFSIVSTTAIGGGGGGSSALGTAAGNGGSGGGSGGFGTTIGTGTAGQGFGGGSSAGAPNYPGGGGGGASAVGGNASTTVAGVGGAGTASSISGTSVTYATGGNGGRYNTGNINGTTASANTGNGGGGGSANGGGLGVVGGAGGSGIVIISYPGSTQQMAGGTVTVAGGNVIHTFTSSGYLSPIVTLNKSLRFRASASAYLSRTPSVASNRKTWTWSAWVKRGSLATGSDQILFRAADGVANFNMVFSTNNTIVVDSGAPNLFTSTAVYRDPSAWYHIVLAFDSDNATEANRCVIYVNGVLQARASGSVSSGLQVAVNTASPHYIGASPSDRFLDGYLAEVNFIDGQALTSSSFGSFNGLGVWQPIRYGGSYGTNGFYLPFTNTTSTTTLVADSSPNGNNWTPNNISLTSGVTYDSMTDVPTNTSATVANYCVMNPLTTGSLTTLSGANLNLVQTSGSSVGNSRSSFAMLTGKWYFETTLTAANVGIYPQLGIMTARDGSRPNNDYPQAGYSTSSLDPTLSVIYMADGTKQTNNSASAYGSSFTNGDVIGIAIDSDNGAIYFSKNGVFQNSGVPTSGASKTGAALTWTGGTVEHVYSVAGYNGTAEAVNFGQRPFSYTAPTGFVALNTFNLPTPTIGATAATTANKYMDATTYTGNGTTLAVTNSGSFQPDFVWVKRRNGASDHYLSNSIGGANKNLYSNRTNSEVTDNSGGYLSSFNSNGFTAITGSTNANETNSNGDTYVGWQWNAGGSTVTNTSGSISAQVRANTTAGFSVVTYTGNATSGATVGHGLGVAPSFIICKSRTQSAIDWPTYHISTGNNGGCTLNETAARVTTSTWWNNTTPSSTVVTLGSAAQTNGNTQSMLLYCFAAVAGYSAFGSYTGNGSSDGPFIYTGFRPRFVLIKRTDTAGNSWLIYDTARVTYNADDLVLYPNLSNAEDSGVPIDVLSNGFKQRTTWTNGNANGGTYIYAAFAESPFKYANAR